LNTLASEFSAFLDQFKAAEPFNAERLKSTLARIHAAADKNEISIKEWRALIVKASKIRRAPRAGAINKR